MFQNLHRLVAGVFSGATAAESVEGACASVTATECAIDIQFRSAGMGRFAPQETGVRSRFS